MGVDSVNITITGRKTEISKTLKERINKKLSKLDKFFPFEAEAYVTATVEKGRNTMEVTVKYKGLYYRAQETTSSMYASLDSVIDTLERQICKNKTRLEKRLKEGAFDSLTDDMKDLQEETDFEIIKSKHFSLKPMDVEEAILQMNLLGHEFFIFKNIVNGQVNVIYRRKDNRYGLIEPAED
jgi:putative sigma-54 modulation protein